MYIYIDAYKENKKIENKENIYQAFLISRWVWQKKIDIEKILNNDIKKEPMTDEQILEKIKVLNAIFGGEVISND